MTLLILITRRQSKKFGLKYFYHNAQKILNTWMKLKVFVNSWSPRNLFYPHEERGQCHRLRLFCQHLHWYNWRRHRTDNNITTVCLVDTFYFQTTSSPLISTIFRLPPWIRISTSCLYWTSTSSKYSSTILCL